jgi:hypothetical protein
MRPGLSRLIAVLSLSGCALVQAAGAASAPADPADDYVVRLQAALILQTLNADLLSHDSATETLERWCAAHELATPARIVAQRVSGAAKPISAAQRVDLKLSASDEVRYRRVQLRCGTVVLSEADNWYVPARLSPAMNHTLETTDTPFGVVVRPLHFTRHTLSARVLWQTLPENWERRSEPADTGATLCRPHEVLQHRALLSLSDGTPFSEVIETYTSAALALPPRLASLPAC